MPAERRGRPCYVGARRPPGLGLPQLSAQQDLRAQPHDRAIQEQPVDQHVSAALDDQRAADVDAARDDVSRPGENADGVNADVHGSAAVVDVDAKPGRIAFSDRSFIGDQPFRANHGREPAGNDDECDGDEPDVHVAATGAACGLVVFVHPYVCAAALDSHHTQRAHH